MKIKFYERFIELCELNGIKPSPALQEMGFSTGCLKKWKSGCTVTVETLEKVVNYFDVPLEYFSSDSPTSSKVALEKTILDEIETLQNLSEQCSKMLNRLENEYKKLGGSDEQ